MAQKGPSGDPQPSGDWRTRALPTVEIPVEITDLLEKVSLVENTLRSFDLAKTQAVFKELEADPSDPTLLSLRQLRENLQAQNEYTEYFFSNIAQDCIQGISDPDKMLFIMYGNTKGWEKKARQLKSIKLFAEIAGIKEQDREFSQEATLAYLKQAWKKQLSRIYGEARKTSTSQISFEEERKLNPKERFLDDQERRNWEPSIIENWRELAEWAGEADSSFDADDFIRANQYRGPVDDKTKVLDAQVLELAGPKAKYEAPQAVLNLLDTLSTSYDDLKSGNKKWEDVENDPKLKKLQGGMMDSSPVVGKIALVMKEGCLRGIFDTDMLMPLLYGAEKGRAEAGVLQGIKKFADYAGVTPEQLVYRRRTLLNLVFKQAWLNKIGDIYASSRKLEKRAPLEKENELNLVERFLYQRRLRGTTPPIVEEWMAYVEWAKQASPNFDMDEFMENSVKPTGEVIEDESIQLPSEEDAVLAGIPADLLAVLKGFSTTYEALRTGVLTKDQIYKDKGRGGLLESLNTMRSHMDPDKNLCGEIIKIAADGAIRGAYDTDTLFWLLLPAGRRERIVERIQLITKFAKIAELPVNKLSYGRKTALLVVRQAWIRKLAQIYHDVYKEPVEELTFEQISNLSIKDRMIYRQRKEQQGDPIIEEWKRLAEWGKGAEEGFSIEDFMNNFPYKPQVTE